MSIALSIMLVAAIVVLFFCGYYVRLIIEKFGLNWLYAVPISVAILMFNIIWALLGMAKSSRWQ